MTDSVNNTVNNGQPIANTSNYSTRDAADVAQGNDFQNRLQQSGNKVSITGSDITGADEDKFALKNAGDHQWYNLFSDKNLSFRGKTGSNEDSIWDFVFEEETLHDIERTSLTITNPNDAKDFNCIEFSVDGDAFIDGQKMKEGEIYMLKDGGAAILQENNLTVKTAEGYSFIQTAVGDASDPLSAVWDGVIGFFGDDGSFHNNNFINISIEAGDKGVRSDGVMPTGLLGQTYDDDTQVYTDAGIDMKDFEVDIPWGIKDT